MGKRIIRSTIAREDAITASSVVTLDLPVNPLSFISYALRWEDGAAIGNTGDPIADALSFIQRIDVLFQGAAIYSMNGRDSFYNSQFVTKKKAHMINNVDAAANRHYLNWIIPFSRVPYWDKECFPKSVRGELQLQVTFTAAVGTVDTPAHIIETVELPESTPQQYLKQTTISKTPTAAGEHEVDLPIGNRIVGIGLFGTTVPTGTSTNRSLGEITLKKNNEEFMITRSNWEVFHSESMARGEFGVVIDRHTHAQAAAADVVTGQQLLGIIGRNQHAYLDFDPNNDDMYLIDTKGLSRIHLLINAEGVADAIRVHPIELISVS